MSASLTLILQNRGGKKFIFELREAAVILTAEKLFQLCDRPLMIGLRSVYSAVVTQRSVSHWSSVDVICVVHSLCYFCHRYLGSSPEVSQSSGQKTSRGSFNKYPASIVLTHTLKLKCREFTLQSIETDDTQRP